MNTNKMLKKMLGGSGKKSSFNMPKMSMGLKPIKGASIKMQNTWKSMSPPQKNNMRKIYKDTDRDRVPDRFDCQPINRFKQDSYAEIDYAVAGIKPVVSVSNDTTGSLRKYAEQKGLYIYETDNNSFFATRDKNNSYIKQLQNEIRNKGYVENKTAGEAYGYPQQAIEGAEQSNQIWQSRVETEMKGEDTQDWDYLEYIPYGMEQQQIREEIEKRKQATTQQPPLPTAHITKWMAKRKQENPDITYEELEEEWAHQQ